MLTIYINGRYLSQKMTGQQRFSAECVAGLDDWLDAHPETLARQRFVILTPPGAAPAPPLRHMSVRAVGSLQGHLWDQVDLPRHAIGGILLSLCGAGPLAHPRHIITIHDAAPFANPDNFTTKFRLAYSVLVPMLAKAARRIVTVSEFSKAELARYCKVSPKKFHVVANGADHILRTPADPSVLAQYGLQGKRFVFAVGSLSANKNFGLVVEAFNRLNRSDLTLAVAGGNNASVFAAYEIKDAANLVRLGYVSDAALRALYENAMCFVLPSLYEGFGIPPQEAMVCGCPTIVSTAPALVETCGEGALFCDPHAPDELAGHIARLADEPELWQRMSERGRARASRYTWASSAGQVADLLQGFSQGRRIATAGQPA